MKLSSSVTLPVSLIMVGLILGVSFYLVQINKQQSIERQNKAELDLEREKLDYQKAQTEKEESSERVNKLLLSSCLSDADDVYWSYVRLNGTDLGDGKYNAYQSVWDEATKRKQSAEDVCFKKYK